MSYGIQTEVKNNINLSAMYILPKIGRNIENENTKKKARLKTLLASLEDKIQERDALTSVEKLSFDQELDIKKLSLEIDLIKETIESL